MYHLLLNSILQCGCSFTFSILGWQNATSLLAELQTMGEWGGERGKERGGTCEKVSIQLVTDRQTRSFMASLIVTILQWPAVYCGPSLGKQTIHLKGRHLFARQWLQSTARSTQMGASESSRPRHQHRATLIASTPQQAINEAVVLRDSLLNVSSSGVASQTREPAN